MRILLTIHCERDLDAGAPGATLRLADEYRRNGHEVEVVDFSRLFPRRIPQQVKMVAFPWAVALWLAKESRRSSFDVIDASTGDAWLVGALRRALRHGPRSTLLATRSHGLEHTNSARCIADAVSGGVPLSWKYPLYHGGYRLSEVARSLRSCDVSLFLNTEDRDYAVDRIGVAPCRAVVVRNGIADRLIGLPPPEPKGPGGRIAVVGSYLPMKGTRHAATALNEWLPRHPDWAVTFLGTDVSEATILAHYDAAVHKRITVVPRYSNADLPNLLAGHSVHLFPTLSEGAPLVLIEAMACGLVPVVSAVPGPLDIVEDGKDALLVPPAVPAAIAAALDRLATDPVLLDRLRRNAHRTAQRYGWREVATEQLHLYEQQLARAAGTTTCGV